jgi:hypothetical protein
MMHPQYEVEDLDAPWRVIDVSSLWKAEEAGI